MTTTTASSTPSGSPTTPAARARRPELPIRVRPAGAPAVGAPARPRGRQDPCRPAGRPARVLPPTVRPLPSAAGAGHRPVPPVPAPVLRRRRAVAVVVLSMVLAGRVVCAVSLLPAAGADGPVPASTTVVVVSADESLQDIARRVAPSADPAAVAERIRTVNGLKSAAVTPGLPLVVPVDR